MRDIDELVRDSLRRQADEAPVAGVLLPAVHARSRQLARRRRLLATALAVTALAATATPVLAAVAHHRRGPGPAVEPPPAPPATSPAPATPTGAARTGTGAVGAGDPALRLVPPAYAVPADSGKQEVISLPFSETNVM